MCLRCFRRMDDIGTRQALIGERLLLWLCHWPRIFQVGLIISKNARRLTASGMAQAVNPRIRIGDLSHVYDINYLYGFFVAFVVYAALTYLVPAPATLVEKIIPGDVEYYEGQDATVSDLERSKGFVEEKKRSSFSGSLTGGGC